MQVLDTGYLKDILNTKGVVMIEFAFVMVINLMPSPLEDWEYIGHFNSCQEAAIFVGLHYPDPNEVEIEYRCLPKEYIYLPKNTQIINRDMKNRSIRYIDSYNFCKAKRSCTET